MNKVLHYGNAVHGPEKNRDEHHPVIERSSVQVFRRHEHCSGSGNELDQLLHVIGA
jgi:hypothetical protein